MSSLITAAMISVAVSPRNSFRPVSISNNTTPNAQMSARLSTGRPFACSGAMYAAVPRITPRSVRAGDRSVGEFASAAATRSSGVERFGEAEVEHLHDAVRRDLHVGRLEIAMDDAFLVRGLERLGDLAGDGEGVGQGCPRHQRVRAAAMSSASVGPGTSSMTR